MQDQRAYRLTSIDMMRGLAIVVMAIDHARDFLLVDTAPDPMRAGAISPAIFATRWITHFCAPVFTLLAGTSIGLMGARKSPRELRRFLLTRGLWLLFVEVTLVSLSTSFRPLGIPQEDGRIRICLQTIWAIGASMIALSLLQPLGRRRCLWLGTAIVVGHNLLDLVWPLSGPGDTGPLWIALHGQLRWEPGPLLVLFYYPLLPWIGVMLLGFGSSGLFELSPERRNAALRRIGLLLTLAFLLLRAADVYGDPNGWQSQSEGLMATAMDFLNTTKYPPSLQFLLMTIGPAAVLCSYADRITRGPWSSLKDVLVVFGRAPFAFYVSHFYLLHVLAIVVGVMQGFPAAELCNHHSFFPDDYGLPLSAVYGMWGLVLLMLYPLCRWVVGVKQRRRDWWLSYL